MTRRSPLAVLVLALLREAPMHPYRMQQLIKERAQDELVNVAQRNSVYQTLDRLVRDGLVEATGTSRDTGRPERTVYRITAPGAALLDEWLTTMLATPAREFPEFPVALALVPMLAPEHLAELLTRRITALEQRRAARAVPPPDLPRLFLVEDEYRTAVEQAELDWLHRLIADLRTGRLTWNPALPDADPAH
ncbi:MAG TPA: PadR family transcriptional regulator [Actinoplanes sp.]|nr:PadR family transcriptional regulator [Actinoplanes sp.]